MSKVLVDESSLHGVGNGIRYVNGQNTTYKPSEFEDAIKDLKPNLGTKTLTENGTYPASDDDLDGFSSVKVAVPPTTAVLVEKTITENGDYDPADDDADGYSAVSVDVPNSYAAEDEGKVVSEGELVSQTSRNITVNGTVDTTLNDEVVVAVPNTYGAGDEGKVVSSGALVAQTSRNVNANGTVDTTTNNQVVVAVPNSYAAGDEGKVVSNGELVAQGSLTVTENGTYDTTLKNSVTVNVSGSAPAVLETLNVTENGTFTPEAGVDGFDEVVVAVNGQLDNTLPDGAYDVAYGNGVFVAVGVGYICACGNGVNWITSDAYELRWESVSFGGGKFVAFGHSITADHRLFIAYSSDGVTWTYVNLLSAVATRTYDCVFYANGKFIAFSSSSLDKVFVSSNGSTWTEENLPETMSGIYKNRVMYFGGKYIAYGRRVVNGTYEAGVLTSTDGETWTFSTISQSWMSSVVFAASDTVLVALPYGTAASAGYYSTDGTNWTSVTLPEPVAVLFATYGNGQFFAVGEDAYALASVDGTAWTIKTIPAGYWISVAGGGGVFVFVDYLAAVSGRYGWNLTALSVTQNGTYTPQSGVDGFSSVVVNVPSGGGGKSIITGTWTFDLEFASSVEDVTT